MRQRYSTAILIGRIAAMLGMVILCGCGTSGETLPYEVRTVMASAETAGMGMRGDRADDPALWVHPTDPAQSLILGTNKVVGLYVYDLDGIEQQQLPVGNLNNVDVRGMLAVGSNDAIGGLSWFRIDAEPARVRHWGDTAVKRAEPYGVCLGVIGGVVTAAATYKDGAAELWQLDGNADTPVAQLQRTIQLPGQLEGCVFDDDYTRLFVGEEERGIWVVNLADTNSEPTLLDTIANGNGLVADVEGLSLYRNGSGDGYLVASAQARDRFVVYDRQPPYAVRGAIKVGANRTAGIDAVTHTDGIDASAIPLPGYPAGVLIVQDDGNPQSEVDQNFKIVDWAGIAEALGLNLPQP